MTERALIVTPAGRKIMPEQVQTFFPADIDGYLFLVERNDKKVEVWKHIYADDHPWKERNNTNHFVEVIDAKAAQNMEAAIAQWNREGAMEEEKSAKAKADRRKAFHSWVDGLPETLCGFKRKGEDLVDGWGNMCFRLENPTIAFKTPEEIEAIILELIADGGIE